MFDDICSDEVKSFPCANDRLNASPAALCPLGLRQLLAFSDFSYVGVNLYTRFLGNRTLASRDS